MTIEHARVGDILRLVRQPVTPYADGIYTSIGIRSFGKGIFKYEPKPGSELGRLRFFEVEPDRLILSNIKGWEGAIAVSNGDHLGCVASNRFLPYTPIGNRIDVHWARWFFLSEEGLELVGRASPGSADRNRTLAVERFESLEIPLPAMDEQQRVAARLEGIERLSSRVREHVDWAGRCLTASRASLVAPPHGDENWRALPLREVLTLAVDSVPVDAETQHEMAGVYSFGRGLFRRSALLGSTTSYKTLNRLRAGQIVMSRLKAWEGAMALVGEAFDGSFLSPEFPTFDINYDLLDDRFGEALFTSEPFWIRLKGSSKGIGARKERVNAERLLDVVVDLPSLSQQRVIASQLDSLKRVEQLGSRRTRVVAALSRSVMNQEFSSIL